MAQNRGLISWIIIAALLVLGLAVGWSIWSSLKEAQAKLQAQKEKMEMLERKDAEMRQYVDSLDNVMANLREREAALVLKRDELQSRLAAVKRQLDRTLARLDQAWEAKEVIGELDQAFPHWAGQFHEAQRADGIHALLAPRFFGAEVAEIKAELDSRQASDAVRDSIISNIDEANRLKDEQIGVLTHKADSLASTYNNLFEEYTALNTKYNKEVKSHWFKFSLGNTISAGLGAGAGYMIGSSLKN